MLDNPLLEVTSMSSKDEADAVNQVEDSCNELTVEFAMLTSVLVPSSEMELALEVSEVKLRLSEKLVIALEFEFRSDKAETLEPASNSGVEE